MMLQSGDCSVGTNYLQNFKAQVITKCMLLERLATVLGYESQGGVQYLRALVLPTGVTHSRIARLLTGTSIWPRTFNAIREHLQTIQGPGQISAPSEAPQDLSPSQAAYYVEVKMLLGARNNMANSDYFNAACNLQLAAFMLRWHCTVSFLVDWDPFLHPNENSTPSVTLLFLGTVRISSGSLHRSLSCQRCLMKFIA